MTATAAHPIGRLTAWRRQTEQVPELIRQAREARTPWADIVAATGYSRATCARLYAEATAAHAARAEAAGDAERADR